MRPTPDRATTTDVVQMSLGFSGADRGESDPSHAVGMAARVPGPAGAAVARAAESAAGRQVRRSWAERAADEFLRSGRRGQPDHADTATPPRAVDAHITRSVAAVGPPALRAFADALSERLTSDRAATAARLAILLRDRLVHALRDVLRALAMPVVPLRDRLLLMPVSGMLDPAQARELTHALLRGVQAHRARVAVIDLAAAGRTDAAETASQPEDDATPPEPARTAIIASHLVHAARATRLLGASVVFSSPSPSLASAVTQLGAGVTTMRIAPDLSAGIREAERMLDHIIPTHAIAQDARWFTRNA